MSNVNNWVIDGKATPPLNRPIILWCPDYCDLGYVIGEWAGHSFSTEISGDEIAQYVQGWSLFLEAE